MKENEDLLGIDSLKLSKVLKEDNKELNSNIIEEESSSNVFKLNNKIPSEEEEDDFSHLETFESYYDLNKKMNKIKRKILIYNIKDHLMMIFLLLSSSMNFNLLYIPFIIIGISYIFLLFNNNSNSRGTKLKIEIVCLIYCILLLIFKIVIVGIIDNEILDSEKQKYKLNNLGIRYNLNEKRIFDVVITFIGEAILLIVCIFSIFISVLYKKINMENQDIEITKGKLFSKIKSIIYINYILLICFSAYNRSYLTYLYILIYHILLIIITFKNNFPTVFHIFKIIRIFLSSVLPIQLFLINIFNIYFLQEKLLKKNIILEGAEGSDIKKVYSLLTKIGFNYSFYRSLLRFFYGCISYAFCVLIIVLMSSCKKIINDYKDLVTLKKKINELEEIDRNKKVDEMEEKKNEVEEKSKIGFLKKIYIFLLNFFTHPDFIIHLIRILSIIWIYNLRNFFSIGIFIGLFFSFILNNIKNNRIIFIIVLIPITIISFGCLHICNIYGYFENLNEDDKEEYLRFGLEKDENNLRYFLIGIYYLFIILFLNSFTDYNSSTKVQMNLPHNKILLSESEISEESSDNKIPLLIKGKKNNDKNVDNEDKKIYYNINFSDVIIKFLYKNIDKITLIAMYFISMHTINIVHFIFIIIFMIQILHSKVIERYNIFIMIIIQFLFLLEYIVELMKYYNEEEFKRNVKFFRFLLSISNEEEEIKLNVEIFCYLAVYAFYIQKQLINSMKYQELDRNKNISLKNYINCNFNNYKRVKYILLFISFKTISEIYIWTMFCLFFYICNLEINLLFSIKLAIFFKVVYNYLQKTQIIGNNKDISLKSNSLLIAYCCFNSFIVYGYQLLCLDYSSLYVDYIKDSKNIVIQNLPSIGLINYKNKKLIKKLLPHFLSNFLSILIYYELKSIYDKIENEKNDAYPNNKVKEKNEHSLNNKDKDKNGASPNNKDKDKEKKLNPINNKLKKITINDIITSKKNKNLIELNNINELKEDKDNNIESINNVSEKNIKLKINNQKIEENLDIKTDIEINNEKIEEKLDKKTDNEVNNIKEDLGQKNEIDKIKDIKDILNNEEEKNKYFIKYNEIENKIRSLNIKYAFYLVIIFLLNLYHPLFFLFICYIFTSHQLSFSIIIYFLIFGLNFIFMFKNILNSSCNYNYNYFHAFIYSQLIRYKSIEIKKHKNISDLYKHQTSKYLSFFNFIFLFLNYFYSIFYSLQDCNNNEINNNNCYKNTTIIEKVSYGNKIKKIAYLSGVYNYSETKDLIKSSGIHLLFCFLIFMSTYLQKIKFIIDNNKNNNRELYNNNNIKKMNLKTILNYFQVIDNKKENVTDENIKTLEELINNYENIEKNKVSKMKKDKINFEKDFIEIFKKSINNKLLLPKNSTKRSIIIFLRIAKKLFEYLIIFVLICGVIIKVNIWSIIYMLIVIYLLLTKKNINKFKKLFIIIIISIFVQKSIFLSNLNEETDPKKINEISFNPWYDNVLGNNYLKHSFVLGLGINKSQILLIWVDYIIVFLIYIYLYYFCFSIFNNNYIELKEWKNQKKSLVYKLLLDKEIREALLKMKKTHQYQSILVCMNSNFEVNMASFSSILKSIDKIKNNKKNKNIFSEKNKNKFKITLFDFILYLFAHNIILIIIAIISMMIYGFLSIIYIFFCLYFLFKSKSINKGKIYYYPFVIKSLLRPIIIIDISFQLIVQIAFIYSKGLSEGFFKKLTDILGLIRITNDELKITNDIYLLLGKCFCFFCMCFQKVIYSSKCFNEFYLKYLIIKTEKSKIISLINTFRFNNERISTMNNSMKLKKDMEDLMKNLQEDLKEWNKKLFSVDNNNNNNLIKNNKNINNENNNNEKNDSEKKDNDNNENENNNSEDISDENDINNNEINENKKNENNNKEKEINNENINNDEIINNIEDEKNMNDPIDEINILNKEKYDNDLINIRNFLNIPLIENKIADQNIIREVVKKWIYSQTFLLKIYLYINKKAFCYRMASKGKEEDKFIINTIQGNNNYIPLIERIIDDSISKLNLSSFRNNEIGTLKKYLKKLNKIKNYDFTKIVSFLNNEQNEKKMKKKILNEKLKELMKQEKYNQFTKLTNGKLFKKYLTKTFLIKKIIIDIKAILSNNFYWVCYFGMIFNHLANASFISLFYPLSIFCYALLEYPRPSKKYWKICLIYTFIVLIIKFIIQKDFIGAFLNNKDRNDSETYYDYYKTFFNHYPIGIKLFDDDDIKKYILYLIYDFIVIILLIININILIVNGLWDRTEKYVENIYEAMNRLSMNKDKIFENQKEIKKFNKEYLSDKITTNRYLKRSTTILKVDKKDYKKMLNLRDKYIEETKNYFEQLFPKIRNEKPGKDFYYLYSLAMVILIFYVLFFYTTMVQDKTFGAVDISTNQFSGMTIILVLIHMIILIIDRVIYLSQNRYWVKYEYNFYDKKRYKLITENNLEYKDIKESIIKLYPDCIKKKDFKIPLEYMPELNKNYNVIIIQNEKFNFPLLEKYILHIFLTIISHIFIFFYITMYGNYNIYNAVYCIKEESTDECNNFLENKTIIIYYMIFLIYYIFSGLQIKYGFYDLKRKSIFKNIDSIQGLIFEIYKLIPFYYQIKNVVDWTFTPTSFDLFDWFKFENLYDEIFKTYRLKYPIEKKRVGKKFKKIFKMLIGGLTSFILVLILVIPLILFSSLNPTNKLNNITSAQMKIYLSFHDDDQEKNYLIFENYWAEEIKGMSKKIRKNYAYDNSFYTKTFPQDQIQIISFYSEPENTLSEFKLSHLISSIESLLNINKTTSNINKESSKTCNLIIEAEFTRPLPSEAKIVTKTTKLLICDIINDKNNTGCLGLNQTYNFFINNTDNDDNITVNVSGFSPLVRLTANSDPKEIELEINKTIILEPLYKNNVFLFNVYFDNIINKTGIQYHTFNDKVSSSTYGYSIIGFYSAFILVIGTYVTSFFNYEPEKIIIGEMPHPEKLLNLCECVKISRYTYDFKKEEYLFNILIEILRTPDFIKKLTQSTVEQFQRRATLPS